MAAIASVLQITVLAILGLTASSAKVQQCDGSDATCAVPRTGAAMLQTSADKDKAQTAKKGENLEGRAATLAAEIESLTNRVSIIMNTVGLAGGAGLLDKSKKPYEQYAALLHSKYDDAALKEVVTDLEGKAASLKANIKSLENEVSGTQFDAALLQSKDDSLTSRMTALEEVVGSCKSRVEALEEKVSLGLPQTKSAPAVAEKGSALLLQNENDEKASATTSSNKTKGAPLKGRLDTVESEITSLQDRVATMETEVMGGAAAAMLEKAAKKGSEDKAEDLKTRVAAAEANAGTLKSKISTLQNQILGGIPESLLQVDEEGSSLKGRIVSLEQVVDKMRTDVSSLEHTVVG